MTRRDVLAGAARLGAFAAMLRRGDAQVASANPTLRKTARACIFINLMGAPSHVDTFDVKDGVWTPPDANIQQASGGVVLSKTLFPEFSQLGSDLLLVRSVQSWEAAHDRGQFYVQTAHPNNPAFAAETPAMGSVVATEMSGNGPMPAFLSLNGSAQQGAKFLSGFAEPLNAPSNPTGLTTIQHNYFGTSSQARYNQKFAFLADMDSAVRNMVNLDPAMAAHATFYDAANKLMYNQLVASVFQFSTDDQNRYGNSGFGNACIVARNAIRAKAGTSFVLINSGGWDTHQNMFDKKYAGNMYQLCNTLDRGAGELIQDLKASGNLASTLIIVMGEFGRTPGPLNTQGGRDHHRFAMSIAMAGGGVRGGRVIGATDSIGYNIIDPGWSQNRQIFMEDLACTVYSALGIDYTQSFTDTPSGRKFEFVPQAATGVYTSVDEVFG
jgi:hypothetical protein